MARFTQGQMYEIDENVFKTFDLDILEFAQKDDMLLDISVYFQSFMDLVYRNQHLRTYYVNRIKYPLCCKKRFLMFM
jgi:hypothetical protein